MKIATGRQSTLGLFAATFALAFAGAASATVPVPGTFVPRECGARASDQAASHAPPEATVVAACVGRLAFVPVEASEDSAAQFRFADGSARTFQVVGSAATMIAEAETPVVYQLRSIDGSEEAVLRVTTSPDQDVKSMAGVYEGVTFQIPEAHPVFTIQSAR